MSSFICSLRFRRFLDIAVFPFAISIVCSTCADAQTRTTGQKVSGAKKAQQPTQAELLNELRIINQRLARIEKILALDSTNKGKLAKKKILSPHLKSTIKTHEVSKESGKLIGTATVKGRDQKIVIHYRHGCVLSRNDIPMTLKEGDFKITLHGKLKLAEKTKIKIMMAGGGVNHDVNWLYINDREIGSTGDDRSKHLVKEMELDVGTHNIRWLLTAGTFRSNILLIKDADGKLLPLTIRKEDEKLVENSELHHVEIKSRQWGWPIPRAWKKVEGLVDPGEAREARK